MNLPKAIFTAGVFLSTRSVVAQDEDHFHGAHWASTSSPFNLGVIRKVSDEGSNTWNQKFDTILEEWSMSDKFNLVSVPGETDEASRTECTGKQGFITVCNADYGRTSWAGIARWRFYIDSRQDERHMFQCIVRLNDFGGNANEDKLLCHEIGHCLGLGHTSVDGSSQGTCMDYSYTAQSMDPSVSDFAVLDKAYANTEPYNSHAIVETPVAPDVPDVQTGTPTGSPTGQPTRQPTGQPTRQPTQQPSSKATGQPTDQPTEAPVTPEEIQTEDEPAECDHSSLLGCWFDSQCDWINNSCVALSETSCSIYSRRSDCRTNANCVWARTRQCLDKGSRLLAEDETESDGVELTDEDGPACSLLDSKDVCHANSDACKWKNDQCRYKKRRLDWSQDPVYMPETYGLDADSYLIDLTDMTMTFEVVHGNIVTRGNVVLKDSHRRLRNAQYED